MEAATDNELEAIKSAAVRANILIRCGECQATYPIEQNGEECEFCGTVLTRPPRYYINVYELDRVFGGHEEGGWWVTTETPQEDMCRTATSKEEAEHIKEEIEATFEEPYPPLHSVMYTGGKFAVFIEDHPARFSPDPWPHYE